MSVVRKRICYVIPSLSTGGTEMQLIRLMKDLVTDHELTVVCTHHAGALAGDARRLGAVVRELDLFSGWDPRAMRRLVQLFRNHRPDVVHTHLFGFDWFACRAAVATGVPVIVSSRRELATWMKPRHLWMQRKANRYVDAVVTNSRAVAAYAIEHETIPPAMIRIIPNGINASDYASVMDVRHIRMRYNIPHYTKIVGTVANFSPVKDYPLFVEMAAELIRRRPDLHFLTVGTGPLQREIRKLIAARDLTERFTMITTVDEMADVYRMLDVVVLCSKSEGFPNVIMEAMAAGTPVVAPNVGGVPELVAADSTGKLVSTRNPADFADAVEWVLEHPAESHHMAERAGEMVRRELTVEKMANAHRRLYAELLAKAHRKGH